MDPNRCPDCRARNSVTEVGVCVQDVLRQQSPAATGASLCAVTYTYRCRVCGAASEVTEFRKHPPTT